MSGSRSMTDREVQLWVQEELEWTPGLDSAGIGVSVEDGAVRLSGQVAGAHERSDAMRAATVITVKSGCTPIAWASILPKSTSYPALLPFSSINPQGG